MLARIVAWSTTRPDRIGDEGDAPMGAGESRRIHGLSELAESVQSSTTVSQLAARTAASALGLLGADSVSVRKYEHAHVRVIHNAGQLAPGVEPWPGEETYPLPDGQRFNRADAARLHRPVDRVGQPPGSR